MIPFPDKRYNVILSDPPWRYRDKANAGKRGASHKYNVMSLDEIKALPITDIATENCALFLWVTAPMMQEGLDVIRAYGFTYKTVAFTWVKTNIKSGTLFMGMGNWTRANTEFCLLGIRGKPKRISASVRQVIMSPLRQHSRKPDETRDRIVQLMGDVPRIELFARQITSGWDAWGDEV